MKKFQITRNKFQKARSYKIKNSVIAIPPQREWQSQEVIPTRSPRQLL
jgi:hypothetical protein